MLRQVCQHFPTDHQRALIERPIERKLFLAGHAGAGKTTAGVGRLLHLLEAGVPADSILVIVPQRTLASSYDALRHSTIPPHPPILT